MVAKPPLRITCERVRGGDLQPGDLFSLVGHEYWDSLPARGALGEKVYVRTSTPAPAREAEVMVYRLTIVKAEVHVNIHGETFTDDDLRRDGQNWCDDE